MRTAQAHGPAFHRTSLERIPCVEGTPTGYTTSLDVVTGLEAVTFTASAACYLRGTRIATPHAEVEIEHLAIGDHVVTASGFVEPIRWIGRRGYAGRQGGTIWPHTGAVALPIRARQRVLGCISAIWMARAMAYEEGLRRCLPPLRETRVLIEQKLAADRDG